jgi:hypothetical protein
MRAEEKEERPNFDEIVGEINREVVKLNDIIDCEQYKESKKKFANDVTIDECFHLYFIQEKLKTSLNLVQKKSD